MRKWKLYLIHHSHTDIGHTDCQEKIERYHADYFRQAMAILDAFGPREAGPVRLCDGHNAALNRATPFAWVMNNFWETNFEADLGGVYEFFFALATAPHGVPEVGAARLRAMNEGLAVIEL